MSAQETANPPAHKLRDSAGITIAENEPSSRVVTLSRLPRITVQVSAASEFGNFHGIFDQMLDNVGDQFVLLSEGSIVYEYSNTRILEHSNTRTFEYSNIRYSDTRLFDYSIIRVFVTGSRAPLSQAGSH